MKLHVGKYTPITSVLQFIYMEEKSRPTNSKLLLEEIRALQDSIDELTDAVSRIKTPRLGRGITGMLFQSMIQGLGFVIGTTVLFAIMIFVLRQAVTSPPFQKWLNSQIESAIDRSLNSLLSNGR